METPKDRTYSFEIIKNYLPAILAIGGGFVAMVLAWKDIGDNKKNIESLKEQVARQYQTQREMNDKTNKEVDQLKLWAEYQKGYQQAEKDFKTKP
jgi:sensor domain CHASE-containing protein